MAEDLIVKAIRGAVIFFGPPGAGKTTLAKFLAETMNARHVESSALIEQAFASGRAVDTLEDGSSIDLVRERERFAQGELNDSRWVTTLLKRVIFEAAEAQQSIVFSGAMRKQVETAALMPFLTERYGKENCVAVLIEIPEEVALERLRARGRAMDQHADFRFQRFRQETLPVVTYLTDHWQVPIIRIANTQPLPFVEQVLKERIVKHFQRRNA